MRVSILCLVMSVCAVLSACGGGASPPKSEATAVEATKESHADTLKSAPTATTSAEKVPVSQGTSAGGDLVAPASDDPWMAPHQMPSGDVLKTMRAAQGKVTACWKAAKKRDPSVSGELKIKFVITHEGAVRVWRNEDSSVGDEDCVNCVGDVIKSLQFPTQKSPGDAWGIYQINFGG